MKEEFIRELLEYEEETDWFDFKRKLRLYGVNGKFNEQGRDELIKDILGFANGNSRIVKKTKYIIIGADNKKSETDGVRKLYDVDYKIPTRSDITTWVNSASAPSIVGIDCHFVSINGFSIYVIEIPPTFELHETTRKLKAKGHFSKYTVFMRQDEHTVPASVKDGVTLQELKQLYRQEISNPPAGIFGAILGAFIAVMFWNSGYRAMKITNRTIELLAGALLPALIGGLLGAEAGWVIREWNSLRYDWPYYSRKKKVKIVLVGTISISITLLPCLITRLL